MTINISTIPVGVSAYELSIGVAEMTLPEDFTGDVAVHVSLTRRQWQIDAVVSASVKTSFACDRCAEQYSQNIDTAFELRYVWSVDDPGMDGEEEVVVLGDGQKVIDLGDTVREYLLLAIPGKKLCREDCRGLCSVCGTNFNERLCTCESGVGDVRWGTLQNLASRNELLS